MEVRAWRLSRPDPAVAPFSRPVPPVCVRLHGNLRRYLPPGQEGLLLSAEAVPAVSALLLRLGIPDGEIAHVGVNGQLAAPEAALHPADRVDVFAPVAGG